MVCVCSLLVTSVVAESNAWSGVQMHGCRTYSQKEKNRAQQLHRKAAGFKGQGNLHAAIQTLKQAIKITPCSADLQHDLAMVDIGGFFLLTELFMLLPMDRRFPKVAESPTLISIFADRWL